MTNGLCDRQFTGSKPTEFVELLRPVLSRGGQLLFIRAVEWNADR